MAGKEIFQALVAWCQTFNRQEHETLLETKQLIHKAVFASKLTCSPGIFEVESVVHIHYHFGQELRYKWQNHTAIFFVLHSD